MLGITDSYQAPEKIMNILTGDEKECIRVFKEFLNYFKCDISYDWFHEYFEDEHADRKNNKQDFTPNVVGILLSRLTGVSKGVIYEPTAGNGSLIISNWWHRVKTLGTDFKPSEHPVECWELSDRSIPLLLLNLSIRGINATVYHGDVLVKSIKSEYRLLNVKDIPFDFSIIEKISYD